MSDDQIVYGLMVAVATGVVVWALAAVLAVVGLVRGVVWAVRATARALHRHPAPASAAAVCDTPTMPLPRQHQGGEVR